MGRWLLALLAIGCGDVVPKDDPPDGPPPPGFKVLSFQELGVLPQPTVLQGRDTARSEMLWGKSVWTFGTTVLNKAATDGKNWHTNSFATTTDLVGNDGLMGLSEKLDTAGTPARLLNPTPDEASYNTNH